MISSQIYKNFLSLEQEEISCLVPLNNNILFPDDNDDFNIEAFFISQTKVNDDIDDHENTVSIPNIEIIIPNISIEDPPEAHYSFTKWDEIPEIVKQKVEELKGLFKNLDECKEDIIHSLEKELFLLKKKKRTKNEKTPFDKNILKRGRPSKDCCLDKGDETTRKYDIDDILYKIKSFFIRTVQISINNIFLSANEGKCLEQRILALDAKKFTKNLERDFNLMALLKTFKDIFSEKISSKYSRINPNHNKKIIQKIYQTKTEQKAITLLDSTFRNALIFLEKNQI